MNLDSQGEKFVLRNVQDVSKLGPPARNFLGNNVDFGLFPIFGLSGSDNRKTVRVKPPYQSYFWPNGIIFHQPSDFPEMRDLPLLNHHLGRGRVRSRWNLARSYDTSTLFSFNKNCWLSTLTRSFAHHDTHSPVILPATNSKRPLKTWAVFTKRKQSSSNFQPSIFRCYLLVSEHSVSAWRIIPISKSSGTPIFRNPPDFQRISPIPPLKCDGLKFEHEIPLNKPYFQGFFKRSHFSWRRSMDPVVLHPGRRTRHLHKGCQAMTHDGVHGFLDGLVNNVWF